MFLHSGGVHTRGHWKGCRRETGGAVRATAGRILIIGRGEGEPYQENWLVSPKAIEMHFIHIPNIRVQPKLNQVLIWPDG